MSADRWRRAMRVMVVVMGSGGMPALGDARVEREGVTSESLRSDGSGDVASRREVAQGGIRLVPALPGTLTPDAEPTTYDPAWRNVANPPALTSRRDPAAPIPHPGAGGIPDPSTKTFVVPPSMRKQDEWMAPRWVVSHPPLLGSLIDLSGFRRGYPFTSPSGFAPPSEAQGVGQP